MKTARVLNAGKADPKDPSKPVATKPEKPHPGWNLTSSEIGAEVQAARAALRSVATVLDPLTCSGKDALLEA
eukprot:677896-Rhodomonas_salina.3